MISNWAPIEGPPDCLPRNRRPCWSWHVGSWNVTHGAAPALTRCTANITLNKDLSKQQLLAKLWSYIHIYIYIHTYTYIIIIYIYTHINMDCHTSSDTFNIPPEKENTLGCVSDEFMQTRWQRQVRSLRIWQGEPSEVPYALLAKGRMISETRMKSCWHFIETIDCTRIVCVSTVIYAQERNHVMSWSCAVYVFWSRRGKLQTPQPQQLQQALNPSSTQCAS